MTSFFADRLPSEWTHWQSANAPPPWRIPSTINAYRWQDTSWVDMERLRVETEISTLFLYIATLRGYLNAFSPIAKLPPEILAEIFLTYMRNQTLDEWRPNAWVSVASVCRQWRSVALQTLSLWTTIDLARFDWMSLLLERSQSAPLSLETLEHHRITSEAVDMAFRNIHRFSKFETPIVTEINLDSQTLPLLNDLALGYPSLRKGDAKAMPSIFDQCNFPNLHSLSLQDFTLNPSSPLFTSSLKELTINRTSTFTTPMLVQILSKTPALEVFYLHSDEKEIRSEAHPSPVPLDQRINLPSLKSLELSLPYAPMGLVSFLNHFNLPPQVSVSVCFALTDRDHELIDSAPLYRNLLPTITGDTRTGPPSKYRTCVIDLSEMSLGLWHNTYPTGEELTSDPDHIADACNGEPGFFAQVVKRNLLSPEVVSNFLELVKQCPLGDVESLLINDASELRWGRHIQNHPIDWHAVCPLMPNVSRIEIHTHNPMSDNYFRGLFSKVLLFTDQIEDLEAEDPPTPPADASSLSSNLSPVLPYLKTLVISRLGFSSTAWRYALWKVLRKRKASGAAAIEKIVINDCDNFSEDDEKKLQEYAGNVVCVAGYDDDDDDFSSY